MSQWIRTDKRLAINLRDSMRCVYCEVEVIAGAHVSEDNAATLDHVIAQANGGGNEAANLVTACVHCNSSKQDMSKIAWGRVCRARGIDTDKMWRRVRRATRTSIKEYRRQAKVALGMIKE